MTIFLSPVRRGTQQPQAKLNEETVRAIRRAHAADPSLRYGDTAKAYGVSRTAIRLVVLRRSWRHVV